MSDDRDVPAPARWPWWQLIFLVCLVLPIALIVGAAAGGLIKSAQIHTVGGRQVMFTESFTFRGVESNGTASQMDFTFAGHTASVDANEVTFDTTDKIAIPSATQKIELSWFKDQIVVVADQTVLWTKKL